MQFKRNPLNLTMKKMVSGLLGSLPGMHLYKLKLTMCFYKIVRCTIYGNYLEIEL